MFREKVSTFSNRLLNLTWAVFYFYLISSAELEQWIFQQVLIVQSGKVTLECADLDLQKIKCL